MPEFFLTLLPLILGGMVLFSGTLMGIYRALKPIFGCSNDGLFGSFEQGKDLVTTTGMLPLLILRAGTSGVIAAFIWSRTKQADKDSTIFFIASIIICGIIALIQHKLTKFAAGKHLVHRLGRRAYRTIGGLAGGVTGGALFGEMFGELLSLEPGIGLPVGIFIGMSVGGMLLGKLDDNELVGTRIDKMFNGIAEEIVIWSVIGLVVCGVSGTIITWRGSEMAFFFWGVVGGGLAGIAYGVTVVFLLLAARAFSRIMSSITAPLLILLKFKTIICNHCLRYTGALKSRYENGRRYCEHCHKEVEYTRDPGAVMLTFGNYTPSKSDGRIFILSDPDFEQKEHPIDVSEVYIDTNTADGRLLERFMTYIVNYPPKHGVESVQIFYRGKLDELGENLKNALRNNFENIEGIR